jgi:hypothetical protein
VQLETGTLAGSSFFDALTPEQYYDGMRADDARARPIKRLMLAVLEDAMRCYQTYASSRNPYRRRLFIEAERWLMDRKADGVFSFENVCETVGIDPGCLRTGLRRWRLQQLDGMNPRRLARRSPVTSTSRISAPLRRRRSKSSQPADDGASIAAATDSKGNGVAHHDNGNDRNSDMSRDSDVSRGQVGYGHDGAIESADGIAAADRAGMSVSLREGSLQRVDLHEIALA